MTKSPDMAKSAATVPQIKFSAVMLLGRCFNIACIALDKSTKIFWPTAISQLKCSLLIIKIV